MVMACALLKEPEGTLDIEHRLRIRKNVEKAVKQGQKVLIRFWSIWGLIHAVSEAMHEERMITQLDRESTPSIKELNLDEDMKGEIERDKHELFQSKELIDNSGSSKEQQQWPEPDNMKLMEEIRDMVRAMKIRSRKGIKKDREKVKIQPSAPLLPRTALLTERRKQNHPPPEEQMLSESSLATSDRELSGSEEDDEMPVMAFLVIRPPAQAGVAMLPYYEGINVEDISRLRKAVTLYGPQSHYVKEMLWGTVKHYGNWIAEDWKVMARALLKEPEYLQWQMWFNELCADKARENNHHANPNVRQLTHPLLSGTGEYDDVNRQAGALEEIHEQLREIGMEAWDRVRPSGEYYGSWTRNIQKTNEPYVEFLARLKTIKRTVIGEQARQQVIKDVSI
ncbi:hypothetical protein HJG60_008048 [Phyllostomus discolor]|uniref:Uncharacterized protein n=1 Tax=Phyllostomus discolor TaxID=89673 RepID=A0A834BEG7_9CHIR|nr:hypothetical protein HJG60_008048 [Phyllostomus discolor]